MHRLLRLLPLFLLAAAWLWRHTLGGLARRAVRAWVRGRLHGYRRRVNVVDTLQPAHLDAPRQVAVVGGGLAGVAAASTLARRGFEVTLYEAADHLGGKLGAWTHTFDDGVERPMEHGFHAFFDNYHNLDAFLRELGVREAFTREDDYVIQQRDGTTLRFGGIDRTPLLNLIDLGARGLYDPRELARLSLGRDTRDRLNDLLTWHPTETPARLDDVSFDAWARAARIPPSMRSAFTAVARAYFAEAQDMSMAELIKSFHGYLLGSDAGLAYSYPADDHGLTLWAPITEHLTTLGVQIRLGRRIDGISRQKNGRLRVAGRPYDHVVLATDVRGTLGILDQSEVAAEDPELVRRVHAVQPRDRYAVLRLWCDKDVRATVPPFTFTERRTALDSVTACHRSQATFRREHAQTGAVVLELHCYRVPDDLKTEADIRAALLSDLAAAFPETAGMQIEREIFYVKDDFTPYHTGLDRHRPGTVTGIDGLVLAGDWVKVAPAVMLMEAAFTSGLLAANTILSREGLREQPVYAVPEHGVLYGLV